MLSTQIKWETKTLNYIIKHGFMSIAITDFKHMCSKIISAHSLLNNRRSRKQKIKLMHVNNRQANGNCMCFNKM